MNNLSEVWSKRFVHYITELQKYMKYIVSGHIAIVIVFVIGAAGYTYSEWLKTAPNDFPAYLLVAFLLSFILMISPPVTLMKHADSVYFLPLETKLKEYLKLALRWTFFSSVFVAIGAFIVPYVFALNPAMLFIDTTVGEVILICLTSFVGIFAVSSALEGYFLHHMKWYERIVAVIGGLLLIYPGIVTDLIGFALVAVIVLVQVLTRKKVKAIA